MEDVFIGLSVTKDSQSIEIYWKEADRGGSGGRGPQMKQKQLTSSIGAKKLHPRLGSGFSTRFEENRAELGVHHLTYVITEGICRHPTRWTTRPVILGAARVAFPQGCWRHSNAKNIPVVSGRFAAMARCLGDSAWTPLYTYVNMRGFQKCGTPKTDDLSGKIPLKWKIWGYPHVCTVYIFMCHMCQVLSCCVFSTEVFCDGTGEQVHMFIVGGPWREGLDGLPWMLVFVQRKKWVNTPEHHIHIRTCKDMIDCILAICYSMLFNAMHGRWCLGCHGMNPGVHGHQMQWYMVMHHLHRSFVYMIFYIDISWGYMPTCICI